MGLYYNGFGWGSWMGWGSPILNLVFFVGVLTVLGLGTGWLVRWLGRRPLAPATGTDPLDIAQRRLAAGEITVAEFEEIQSRLQL